LFWTSAAMATVNTIPKTIKNTIAFDFMKYPLGSIHSIPNPDIRVTPVLPKSTG